MNLQQWLEVVIGTAVTLAPFVAFLVATIKTAAGDRLQARYYPIVSIGIGVGVAYLVAYASTLIPFREAAIAGALAGGIASGLYHYGQSQETPTNPSVHG